MNGKVEKERVLRVIGELKKAGMQQVFVTDSVSVKYLTGLRMNCRERMNGIYIDINGRVIAVMNELQRTFELEGGERLFYHDIQDPVQVLKQLALPGVFCIDRSFPAMFLFRMMELCPELTLVQDSSVDLVRLKKNEEERELMRASSAVNDLVVEASLKRARSGMTEIELSRIVSEEFAKYPGVQNSGFCLVQFGVNCADPHHGPGPSVLQEGDAVLLDIGKPVNGYYCDITRTAFMGKADAFQRELYEIVLEANLQGIEACAPGVPASEIDRAARNVIEKAGYGQYYTHRTGHNIGIEDHEWPDISLSNPRPVEPGMCFSIEPGIYIPGKAGIRVEDVVMITENGKEVLNKADKSFRIL